MFRLNVRTGDPFVCCQLIWASLLRLVQLRGRGWGLFEDLGCDDEAVDGLAELAREIEELFHMIADFYFLFSMKTRCRWMQQAPAGTHGAPQANHVSGPRPFNADTDHGYHVHCTEANVYQPPVH